MDEQDDSGMPDTVLLGGASRKEEPQDPWGGKGDESLQENWGGGNGQAKPPEDAWGLGNEDEHPFTPDPSLFKDMDLGGEEEAEAPAQSRFRLTKKRMIISGAIVTVLVAGVGGFFAVKGFLGSRAGKSGGASEAARVAEAVPVRALVPGGKPVENYQGAQSVRLELKPFVIPYDDAEKQTFLFLRVALEIDEKETYALLEANMPLLRGVIYDTVLEELEGAGDKDVFTGALEEKVAEKLKAVFSAQGVKKVHFSNKYSV